MKQNFVLCQVEPILKHSKYNSNYNSYLDIPVTRYASTKLVAG